MASKSKRGVVNATSTSIGVSTGIGMKLIQYVFRPSATILACLLWGISSSASAQGTTEFPGPVPIAQSPPSPPPSSAPTVTDPSPFASVTALGQTLKNDGVYLQLGYVYDMNSLVLGGLKPGTLPNGELYFGTVLDLQTLLNIPGASFHVTFDERSGFGLNANVGTQGPLPADTGPTRSIRLSEFFWEEGFDEDRIDVRIGRTNPTLDFATSDISCQFVGGIICSQPGSWYFSNNNPAYPASSWGGFLNVTATPTVYVRTGVFDDDTSFGGANGLNWNVEHSAGVFVPMEVGYLTNFTNARYPAKYDVGGYWDAASYTTPAGVPLQGRTAIYAQAQQTVWRPDRSTHQSLTLFGGGIFYNGGAPYWSQIYAGAFDRAPFAWRQNDTVGVIGSYYANASNQAPTAPSQWIYELNYGYSIIPGVVLKPYTQYVVAPNDLLPLPGTKRPSNAWIVGFQVSVDVGQMFGFPQFVAY
jgi:porin